MCDCLSSTQSQQTSLVLELLLSLLYFTQVPVFYHQQASVLEKPILWIFKATDLFDPQPRSLKYNINILTTGLSCIQDTVNFTEAAPGGFLETQLHLR